MLRTVDGLSLLVYSGFEQNCEKGAHSWSTTDYQRFCALFRFRPVYRHLRHSSEKEITVNSWQKEQKEAVKHRVRAISPNEARITGINVGKRELTVLRGISRSLLVLLGFEHIILRYFSVISQKRMEVSDILSSQP